MNETGIAVRRDLTPDVFQMIQTIAPVMHQARFFGVHSPEQAAAVMIKGFELGLPLAASFEFIHIVEGKPSLSPRGALALIYCSGQLEGFTVKDARDSCTVWMKRKNGVEHAITWTVDDAKRAGVFKAGGNWEKYGANMCRWRAIGFCADVVFPDLLGGLKRADEFGATIDTGGNVVEGEWAAAPEPAAVQPPADVPPPADAPTLDQLLEKYTAEAIVAANDGKVPDTEQELAWVALKLDGGMATTRQIGQLQASADRLGISVVDAELLANEHGQASLGGLSKAQATELLAALRQRERATAGV